MDRFLEQAEGVVIYQIRKTWLEMAKLYNEFAAKHDLTMPMGLTLLAINPEKGTPVTKIAPRMGMEPNSLSRLLNSLEDKGLIVRKKDKADKRQVFICLTEAGRDKRELSYKVVFDLNTRLMQEISPAKMQAFFEVIGQINSIVREEEERLEHETTKENA